MKVILVENDRMVINDVQFCLQVRWPEAAIVAIGEGQKGIDLVELETPDLVLVGSNLSDIDIAGFITSIREFSDVPIIVLAKSMSDMDKVRCLEAGADDYINTPISPMELLAKVRVLLRRIWGIGYTSKEEHTISIGDKLVVNPNTREVQLADRPIRLTATEYRLLLELVRNRGRVVSNEILVQRVWGSEYAHDIGFIKRYVYRLRQKLDDRNGQPLIVSSRGIGYRIG
jgi:two-component system KDP operon response regulator KdpE